MSSQLILTLLENHILIKSLILIVFCIQLSHSAPTTSREKSDIRSDGDAVLYLQKFGYMDGSTSTSKSSEENFSNSVLEFQKFAGITQTGFLDNETIRMMNTPRCGNVDIVGKSGDAKRRKRYSLLGDEWERTLVFLTYKIVVYPNECLISKQKVDQVIAKAFEIWSEVTQLCFEAKKKGGVDIKIMFVSYDHGDGYPFDGPHGVLAHAFSPDDGGDIHFDNSEYWTICTVDGIDLLWVATHEIGHSLGLGHSAVQDAVMYPFFTGYVPGFDLDIDDINGIQEIYGTKQTCCGSGCGSGCGSSFGCGCGCGCGTGS